MNHQVKVQFSKRIVDYFVVIGLGESYSLDDNGTNSSTLPAEVLEQYPIAESSHVDLPSGLPLFCFPDGLHIYEDEKCPTFHSFVNTLQDGVHLLGCCLVYSQQVTSRQAVAFDHQFQSSKPVYTDYCLCLISTWPFVCQFKQFLCDIYQLATHQLSYPIERTICNFVDDVPAPPAGRVDVTYFLGDQPITFRCPPANEPNAWLSLPLYPLFECLTPENVLLLMTLVLTERQILFISSQYSLLTSCAEAITSLIYPMTWVHAYIPILPMQLIGALGAPFPFILGVHSSFLARHDCCVDKDTVQVFLDDNVILCGERGPPPVLPERRARKLLSSLTNRFAVFEQRGASWKELKLPVYDNAYPAVDKLKSDSATMRGRLDADSADSAVMSESELRASFLKFFVGILMDYRKYLIFPTANDPKPIVKFKFSEFTAAQPPESRPFVTEMLATQFFTQFVDERLTSNSLNHDVLFFDESIDAKLNRYSFRFNRDIETPFLSDEAQKHAKTYVCPSPNLLHIPQEFIETPQQKKFPQLRREWFCPPRHLSVNFETNTLQPIRLKKLVSSVPALGSAPHVSSVACVYSLFVVLLCGCTRCALDPLRSRRHKATTKSSFSSTRDLVDRLIGSRVINSPAAAAVEVSGEEVSGEEVSGEEVTGEEVSGEEVSGEEVSGDTEAAVTSAALLSFKVAIEALNCMSARECVPDEMVYHSLMSSASSCGDVARCIDILIYMNNAGWCPDRSMLHSLAVAVANADITTTPNTGSMKKTESTYKSIDPAQIWNVNDWRSCRQGAGVLVSPQRSAGSSGTSAATNESLADILFGSSGNVNADDQPRHDFNFPELRWNFSSKSGASCHTPAASSKLQRQMNISELLLLNMFPNLVINLENKLGTSCTSSHCKSKGPLSIVDLYKGWKCGDPNKYTNRCVRCGCSFVPRFTVHSTASSWQGSEGPGSVLWCELLSPWTLRKEVMTVVQEDGVQGLLSSSFRHSSAQHSCVFWNTVVSCRLHGLPYSFLLCDNSICAAFPPK